MSCSSSEWQVLDPIYLQKKEIIKKKKEKEWAPGSEDHGGHGGEIYNVHGFEDSILLTQAILLKLTCIHADRHSQNPSHFSLETDGFLNLKITQKAKNLAKLGQS